MRRAIVVTAMLVATGMAAMLGAPGEVAPPARAQSSTYDEASSYRFLGDLQDAVMAASRVVGIQAQRQDYQRAIGPGALEDAMLAAYTSLKLQVTASQRTELRDRANAVSPANAEAIARVLYALAEGQSAIASELLALPVEDYQLLYACTRPPSDPRNPCSDSARARDIAMNKVNRTVVIHAGLNILSAIQKSFPQFQSESVSGTTNVFVDPLQLVVVGGGASNDLHLGNSVDLSSFDSGVQLLVVELSGDDTSKNRPEGTSVRSRSGTGGLTQTQDQSTSVGLLVSVALDFGGNDQYDCLNGCQGSGTMGVGILIDLSGNDVYMASSTSQGYAAVGLGLLIDASGDDRYESASRSQGFGYLGGVGLLIDGLGRDEYRGEILVQGVGSNGGGGFLFDGAGDDRYRAVAVTGGALSQGTSYMTGTGALADRQGTDEYTLSGGGRGHIHPAPPPWSVGSAVFYDGDGSGDKYDTTAPGANGQSWSQGTVGYSRDL